MLTAAMLACGCMMGQPSREFAPQDKAALSRTPAAAADIRSAARDAAALDDAVARVADLQYAQAAAMLAPLIDRFESAPDATRCGEAIFWLGYCHEKQLRPADARTLYTRAAGVYGSTPGGQMAARRLLMMDQ
jgi:TolA-binding protein